MPGLNLLLMSPSMTPWKEHIESPNTLEKEDLLLQNLERITNHLRNFRRITSRNYSASSSYQPSKFLKEPSSYQTQFLLRDFIKFHPLVNKSAKTTSTSLCVALHPDLPSAEFPTPTDNLQPPTHISPYLPAHLVCCRDRGTGIMETSRTEAGTQDRLSDGMETRDAVQPDLPYGRRRWTGLIDSYSTN